MSKPIVTRAAYETMQFFEIDIPAGHTAESFIETDEFKEACIALIKSDFIEFQVEREYDINGEEI